MRQIDNKFLQNSMNKINNSQKNALNYKIVRCKNWEKDGNCKYGVQCTFAHGDTELRNKNDNLYQMQPGMGVMMQPFMFDMNIMMQMGQMNIPNIENQIPINSIMVGISRKKEIQQNINENNGKNSEKK